MSRHISLQIDELVLQGATLTPREVALFERSLVQTLEELLARNEGWRTPQAADRIALTLDRPQPGASPGSLSSAEMLGVSVGRTLAGQVFPSGPEGTSC